jgi:hypothetical protein
MGSYQGVLYKAILLSRRGIFPMSTGALDEGCGVSKLFGISQTGRLQNL